MVHLEEDLTILVATGATLSLIPPALADRLGVVRLPRRQVIVLADGRRVEAEVRRDELLLGVETLETLGLAVDPTTGSLKPTKSFTVRLGGVGVARQPAEAD